MIPVARALRFTAVAVWLMTCASGALAQVSANLVQHVGERLPLDTLLVDENGVEAPLARFFGELPVVLVFGYYRCPTLCTTLMEGVLTGVAASHVAADAYRVVGVSIDPREGAADAATKARAYHALYDQVPVSLLTGRESQTRRLAQAAGLSYAYDSRVDQFSHPLAFLVVSPDGRISRYFPGISFDPGEVRLALVEASEGRIGSLSERIFLRCAHYDAAAGRYNFAVMSAVRAFCALIVTALGFWMWRRRAVS